MVLQRSTGQYDLSITLQSHGTARGPCHTILDRVSLIKAYHIPVLPGQGVLLSHQDSIGSDHHITFIRTLDEHLLILLLVDIYGSKRRSELLQLILPVQHQ